MKRQALLTTVPSDSHDWPLAFIERFLADSGLEVENLGTCAPYDLVVDTCRESTPDLVVLSTVNGHGYMEGVELARRLAALPNRGEMKLVAGGKLGTQRELEPYYAEELRRAGFDEVYYGPEAMGEFLEFLRHESLEPVAAG